MAWRFPAALLLTLAVAAHGRGQTCTLSEPVKTGDCFHYTIDMTLTGEMRFQKESGNVPVKLTASASHVFPERILGLTGNLVDKAARSYDTARVTIDRGNDRSECVLRPARKLVVAQRHKDVQMAYSPAGALYRNELELIGGHFDTLVLTALLPGKEVKVGETWKLPNLVAQAVCGLEGMTENKLEAKLDRVAGDVATFSITGTCAGVEAGALVKTTVDATGTFDAKSHHLTGLTCKQKCERDQGPVSPASTMTVTVTVARKAVPQPDELTDVALVAVPQGYAPPGPMTNLEFRDPKDRFALLHTRDWYLTAVTGEHTVLRLMDRGDYVAQLTVTPWTAAKKGEHLAPEQFKSAMNSTSGWRPEKELQASEVPSDGKYVYRLSEVGQLDGVQVLQNFFLIAAPTGEQVVLTFTLAPKQADKLGARDLSMAASIEVPAGADKPAAPAKVDEPAKK